MRIAQQIELSDTERVTLTKWSRGRSTPARLVLRAKIVLLAADGKANNEIALELQTSSSWFSSFNRVSLASWKAFSCCSRFYEQCEVTGDADKSVTVNPPGKTDCSNIASPAAPDA